jgi:cellulose synthase operon protein C
VMLAGARARLAGKDNKGAQTILTRASRLAETEASALVQIALLQMAADDARGALYTATKALQADPAHLPARALSVDANLRLGDTAAAEQAAREIAQRHPKLALSAALQGDVAAARKQWPAALDAYRRAQQLEPSTANVARLYRAQERQNPKDAVQTAEAWLRTRPGDTQIRGLLAATHARAGNLPQARAAYEALVSSAPDDAEALNNLANVMLLQKDAKALQVAEKALARKPGVPHIIGTTGWAAYHAGESDRALQLLRDARLRDPSNADTRYFLGVVLASKGRNAEARDELRGAIASGPGFLHAKAAQSLLDSLN